MLGEYVTYPSLATIVSEQGPMGLPEVDAVVQLLARALDTAHQAGLVHRALKPQNIFATPLDATTWNVRVTDFGIGCSARLFAAPTWMDGHAWLALKLSRPTRRHHRRQPWTCTPMGLVVFYLFDGQVALPRVSSRSTGSQHALGGDDGSDANGFPAST